MLSNPNQRVTWWDGAPTKASTGQTLKVLTKARKVKRRIAARDLARRQRTPFERDFVQEKATHSKQNRKRNQSIKEDKDNLKHIDLSIIAMAANISRLNTLIYRILDPDSPSKDGPAKVGQTENKGSPAHSIHCDSDEDGEGAIDSEFSIRPVGQSDEASARKTYARPLSTEPSPPS